jgi:ATP-dependent DNA helicase DinG
VPRDLGGLLKKSLFDKGLPVVFSSATLSTGGDFSYFARTLGLKDPSGSSVDSSFEFEKQVSVYLPRRFPPGDRETWFPPGRKALVSLLRLSGWRALGLPVSPFDVPENSIQRSKNTEFPL